MLLYIFYNADLLEIPNNISKEDAVGYVDNITLLSIGNNSTETTEQIEDMMVRKEGGQQWRVSHNSFFGVTESAIAHYSRKMISDSESNNCHILFYRPVLILEGQMVQEVNQYKYLGMIIDAQLRWKEQE